MSDAADTLIYKLCSHEAWEQTLRTGTFPPAPVDEADGYIHLSSAAQLRETAAKHFAGMDGLVLLAVATEQLPAGTLRWEPSRGGALFPHIYGDLPVSAVRWAHELARGGDGTLEFPDHVPG